MGKRSGGKSDYLSFHTCPVVTIRPIQTPKEVDNVVTGMVFSGSLASMTWYQGTRPLLVSVTLKSLVISNGITSLGGGGNGKHRGVTGPQ